MERIVIRHLTGSKAHQGEEFPLKDVKELMLGRDPSSAIRYDLDRDDLVSRNHAKIIRDAVDEMKFIVIDLGSKNGTYVNQERIDGPTQLLPGAIIQLGIGGPEFQFDIEPRPQTIPPSTRLSTVDWAEVKADVLPPPTRVGDSGAPASSPSASAEARKPVGFTTIQRLIVDRLTGSESRSRKYLVNSLAAVLGVIVLVAGIIVYLHRTTQQDIHAAQASIRTAQENIRETHQDVQERQQAQAQIISPAEIAAIYGPATVHIAVSWKLVSALTGGQVYHRYLPKVDKNRRLTMQPTYVRLPNGTIEPWLVPDSEKGTNKPVGGIHTGSGFVVTGDGFILTNRHVAATWETRQPMPLPGQLYEYDAGSKRMKWVKDLEKYEGDLQNWIPAKSRQFGGRVIEAKLLDGRYEYMDVTFAKGNLRIPATLVRVSNEHDVAMIKVETPQALKKVDLHDSYDETKPGDSITILGYPAISANPMVQTASQDPFHRLSDVAIVPDPTVTTGVIGKVIRGKAKPVGGEVDHYYAGSDEFQLTANATGAGNSGGPLFNERGKVIGIFYAGRSRQGDASITFAIPIKFGMNLMKVSPVLQ
jgi:serine protease Do